MGGFAWGAVELVKRLDTLPPRLARYRWAAISGASHSTEGREEASLRRRLWPKRAPLLSTHNSREPSAGVRIAQPRHRARKQPRSPHPKPPSRRTLVQSRPEPFPGAGPALSLPPIASPRTSRAKIQDTAAPSPPALLRGRLCFLFSLPYGIMWSRHNRYSRTRPGRLVPKITDPGFEFWSDC